MNETTNELEEEDQKLFLIVSTFNLRDLQTFVTLKNYLKINKVDLDKIDYFLQKYYIDEKGHIKLRKIKRTPEQRKIWKQKLKNEKYGKIEHKL